MVALGASAAPIGLKNSLRDSRGRNGHVSVENLKTARSLAKSKGTTSAHHRVKAAETNDWGIISDPQGEKKTYKNTGKGMAYGLMGPYITEFNGIADIIWGENNEVYINQILLGNSAYVKGTLSEDGKKIVVQLPQYLAIEDLSDIGEPNLVTSISIGDKFETDGSFDYAPLSAEQNVITYTVLDDGTVEGDFDFSFEYDEESAQYLWPDRLLGMFATQEDDPENTFFYMEANWYQSFVPFDNVPNTVPEGVTMESDWVVSDAEGRNVFISVGSDAEHVYIQGMTDEFLPGGVVVGDIQDNGKVVFNKQYVGYAEEDSELVFLLLGKSIRVQDPQSGEMLWDVEFYDEEGNMYRSSVFNYDKEAKKITPDGQEAIVFNVYEDHLDYSILDYFINPGFRWISKSEMNAAPANPVYVGLHDYTELDGSMAVIWGVSGLTVDGVPLHTENMSYSFYLNGELFGFINDVYDFSKYGMNDEVYTVLPLTLETPDFWYMGGQLTCCLYEGDLDKVGLKLFNKGTDKTYESELVTSDLSEIRENLASGKTIRSVAYYDLQGRRLARPVSGICVARTTFSDGTQVTSKVMTR